MKSQQKINLLFFLIIIGLIVALIVVSIEENNHLKKQVTLPESELQLMEIKSEQQRNVADVFGIVKAEVEVDVKMNVSGKIDHDNRSLLPGTTFKKNEILIKVHRLEVLYELLIARLNFKMHIQKSLEKIGEQFPKEKSKWQEFEGKIERTLPLPDLPNKVSKEEEQLLNELNVYTMYYSVKKIERTTEEYIYAAPFDGFISESSIGPSSIIKLNAPLMRLSKSNTFQVVAHLPIQSVNDYELAKQVYFISSQNDTLGIGSFKRIGAQLSDSSKIEVFFTIQPQSQTIQNSTVRIVLPKHERNNTVSLPQSAVLNNVVYLFSEDKIIEAPVQIVTQKNDSVQVKGLPNPCFVIKQAEKASRK